MFGVEEVKYLGFKLRGNKLLVDPTKVKATNAWETPACKRNVEYFLVMINFYRRFTKNCTKIAKPLTELTKNVPFQ